MADTRSGGGRRVPGLEELATLAGGGAVDASRLTRRRGTETDVGAPAVVGLGRCPGKR